MKLGDAAMLVMKKQLDTNADIDAKKYVCKVIKYDTKQAALYVNLEKDNLEDISLDAIYECDVKQEEEFVVCEGRVGERYFNKYGKVIKIEIKNGFYKINVKSVENKVQNAI